jgi:hypothetical protein
MNAIAAGVITFVCTFVLAWLATVVRGALPESHTKKESQDVVRLGMGLVATMTALLLGLVTADAKDSFDLTEATVRNSFYDFLTLDRTLAQYGPETRTIRDHIREVAQSRLDTSWSRGFFDRHRGPGFQPGQGAEAIEDQLLALQPATDRQRWLKAEALDVTQDVLKSRWRVFGRGGASVPATFLVVVIAWLSLTFASFGLFAPRNPTVVVAFAIASISVAAAVFLILELDGPFDGLIQISKGPLQFVVDNLGK